MHEQASEELEPAADEVLPGHEYDTPPTQYWFAGHCPQELLSPLRTMEGQRAVGPLVYRARAVVAGSKKMGYKTMSSYHPWMPNWRLMLLGAELEQPLNPKPTLFPPSIYALSVVHDWVIVN